MPGVMSDIKDGGHGLAEARNDQKPQADFPGSGFHLRPECDRQCPCAHPPGEEHQRQHPAIMTKGIFTHHAKGRIKFRAQNMQAGKQQERGRRRHDGETRGCCFDLRWIVCQNSNFHCIIPSFTAPLAVHQDDCRCQ